MSLTKKIFYHVMDYLMAMLIAIFCEYMYMNEWRHTILWFEFNNEDDIIVFIIGLIIFAITKLIFKFKNI